jgi:Ca2+-binding EF-hand superfamily protein
MMMKTPLALLATTLIAPLLATVASAQQLPDRPIQRSEVISAVKAQFQKIDANHDGIVTPGEFQAYRARQAAGGGGNESPFSHVGSHWFDHADPDGTGRVTLTMAEAHPLQLFDMADMNHDGVVSPSEAHMAMALSSFGK